MSKIAAIISIVCFAICAWACGSVQAGPDEFPDIYKVMCVNAPDGCPCFSKPGGPEQTRVYHNEAVTGLGGVVDGWQKIERAGAACFFQAAALERSAYSRVLTAPRQREDHAPLPLAKLVDGFAAGDGTEKLAGYSVRELGKFWATYYHLALEEFHPGPPVAVLSPEGRVLGQASQEFLDQVTWEGSGISKAGLRLHYSGRKNRFNLYPADLWGWGAGLGYRVLPYRTIAVNFSGFCRRLMGTGRGCGKNDILGMLVRIREVAGRKIKMSNGERHDGYFCATDTGSPNYIKEDRIDIFVGVHGGGNPYLPPGRRGNDLIRGGIVNVVPSDWRLWSSKKDRVWCALDRLPADPARPRPGDCSHDYHTVAAHKALVIEAVLQADGRPLRCRKNPDVSGIALQSGNNR